MTSGVGSARNMASRRSRTLLRPSRPKAHVAGHLGIDRRHHLGQDRDQVEYRPDATTGRGSHLGIPVLQVSCSPEANTGIILNGLTSR
jgi:hypothetical protein